MAKKTFENELNEAPELCNMTENEAEGTKNGSQKRKPKRHIITVATVKGGTGKTSATGAIAQAAALDGKKVLAIDMDSQTSLSFWFNAKDTGKTAYNIFLDGNARDAIQKTDFGIDLIPGSENLIAVKTGPNSSRRLEDALDPIKKEYDLIIIDTGPAMSELLFNAVFAANEILMPLATNIHSIRGMLAIVDIVKQARKTKRGIHFAGAFMSDYNRRPVISRELRDTAIEYCDKYNIPYLGEVRQNVKVEEAQAAALPLYSYAPKCPAALDYEEIYREIFY